MVIFSTAASLKFRIWAIISFLWIYDLYHRFIPRYKTMASILMHRCSSALTTNLPNPFSGFESLYVSENLFLLSYFSLILLPAYLLADDMFRLGIAGTRPWTIYFFSKSQFSDFQNTWMTSYCAIFHWYFSDFLIYLLVAIVVLMPLADLMICNWPWLCFISPWRRCTKIMMFSAKKPQGCNHVALLLFGEYTPPDRLELSASWSPCHLVGLP